MTAHIHRPYILPAPSFLTMQVGVCRCGALKAYPLTMDADVRPWRDHEAEKAGPRWSRR